MKPWQRSRNVAVVLIISESVSNSHRRRRRRISSNLTNSLHDVIFVHVAAIQRGPFGLVHRASACQLAAALGVRLAQ